MKKFTSYEKMTALLSCGTLEDITDSKRAAEYLQDVSCTLDEKNRVYMFTATEEAKKKYDFEDIVQANTLQGFVNILFDAFMKVDLLLEHKNKTS